MTAIITLVCHHRLMLPRSAAAGVGPKCAHRIAASVVVPGFRVETVVAADHGAITLVLLPVAVTP